MNEEMRETSKHHEQHHAVAIWSVHGARCPLVGLGLKNTSFLLQLENPHHHLVDRVSSFPYPPKQLIHLQTDKDVSDSPSLGLGFAVDAAAGPVAGT